MPPMAKISAAKMGPMNWLPGKTGAWKPSHICSMWL